MFTSGTTGEPKGVLLSHKSLVLATEHIISHVKIPMKMLSFC